MKNDVVIPDIPKLVGNTFMTMTKILDTVLYEKRKIMEEEIHHYKQINP